MPPCMNSVKIPANVMAFLKEEKVQPTKSRCCVDLSSHLYLMYRGCFAADYNITILVNDILPVQTNLIPVFCLLLLACQCLKELIFIKLFEWLLYIVEMRKAKVCLGV